MSVRHAFRYTSKFLRSSSASRLDSGTLVDWLSSSRAATDENEESPQRHLAQQARRNWVFDVDDTESSGVIQGSIDSVSSGRVFHHDHRQQCSSLGMSSMADPAHLIESVMAQWSPSLYAYALFEVVDIVEHMLLAGLLPREAVGCSVASWFMSPTVVWKHRAVLVRAFGDERWKVVATMLEWMQAEYDRTASPLIRACLAHCVDLEWAPFLRGVAAFGLDSHDTAVHIPGVFEAAIKGALTAKLALPGAEARERAYVMSRLLLETAVEFGSHTLLNMSLDISLQYQFPVDYKSMLRVQLVFDKAGRRSQDVRLRTSGSLCEVLPVWLRSYYPTCFANGPLLELPATAPEEESQKGGDNSTSNPPRLRQAEALFAGLQVDGAPRSHDDAIIWDAAELEQLRKLTAEDLRKSRHCSSSRDTRDAAPAQNFGIEVTSKSCGVEELPSRQSDTPLFTDSRAPNLFFDDVEHRHGSTAKALGEAIRKKQEVRQKLIALGPAHFEADVLHTDAYHISRLHASIVAKSTGQHRHSTVPFSRLIKATPDVTIDVSPMAAPLA